MKYQNKINKSIKLVKKPKNKQNICMNLKTEKEKSETLKNFNIVKYFI